MGVTWKPLSTCIYSSPYFRLCQRTTARTSSRSSSNPKTDLFAKRGMQRQAYFTLLSTAVRSQQTQRDHFCKTEHTEDIEIETLSQTVSHKVYIGPVPYRAVNVELFPIPHTSEQYEETDVSRWWHARLVELKSCISSPVHDHLHVLTPGSFLLSDSYSPKTEEDGRNFGKGQICT